MANNNETVKIMLKKSTIGAPDKHVKIVRALGLKKTNQVVEHQKSDTIMGMVNKIPHLVSIVQ